MLFEWKGCYEPHQFKLYASRDGENWFVYARISTLRPPSGRKQSVLPWRFVHCGQDRSSLDGCAMRLFLSRHPREKCEALRDYGHALNVRTAISCPLPPTG